MMFEAAFVLSMLSDLPARAPALRPIGTVDASTLIGLNIIPASAGTDTQLRAAVGWPIQFPLQLGSKNNERLVLTPRLVFWTDRPLATFDLRFGFRIDLPGAGHVNPIIGLGSTLEFAPVVRPAASPEIGLRIGSAGNGGLAAIYLVAQGDFGVPNDLSPAARGTLSIGWGIF